VEAVAYEAGTGCGFRVPTGVTGMGAGCPGPLEVDFLVAVRGGWLGMIIRLWPVTGVDTDGVVAAELLEVPGPCRARRESLGISRSGRSGVRPSSKGLSGNRVLQ